MTIPRFLGFAGERERLAQFLAALVPDGRSPQRLNRVFDSGELVVFATPETPLVRLAGERGLVVGGVFSRNSCAPTKELNGPASDRAASSAGQSLVESHWGNYVAFLKGDGGLAVLRDPSATVPAYHASIDGITVYFSDLTLCDDLGVAEGGVDEEFLRQWLTYPGLRTSRTGLAGISELVAGTVHRLNGARSEINALWSPWAVIQRSPSITNFEEAARQVRSTVIRTVTAQAVDRGRLGLELSGGLDSSIVAAALANGGIFLPAVNFATRLPDGNERDYAMTVARHFGLKLAEVEEDDQPFELRRPSRTSLRPPLTAALQPLNRALCAFARQAGLSGLVTGGGGDNLFCYLTTASPILDAMRDRGPAAAITATRNVASVAGCTIWTAGRFAIRKRIAQARRPAWPRDERFLAPAGIAEQMDAHPWLLAPREARVGKLEHVNSILLAHHYMEPEHPSGEAIIHPLINQPLIELCLTIPSWLWIHGGRNRSVAREAFADRLPAQTINRRTKGRFESMCARAFEENRTSLTELLLGGELAQRRLIQVDKVASYLRGSGPAPDDDYFRLFDLASLELWLRSRTA